MVIDLKVGKFIYAFEGLTSKTLVCEYRLAMPDEKRLAAEIEKTHWRLEAPVQALAL